MTGAFDAALRSFTSPRVEGYEVLRLLGEGAEARVYLARDASGREVALKRWLDPAVTAADRERLRREVDALGRVEHDGLARLLELTRDDRGAPCLVLELVEGTTLAELIRQAGRLEPDRAAEVALALADAVGCLHAHGVLHRDVKPSNVVIRQRDRHPVLVDLGLALERERRADAPDVGSSVAGTLPYMAPEQLGAEVPGAAAPAIDERVDIYALGALLFEALTGRPPWTTQGSWVRRNRSPWDEPVFPEVRARTRDVPPALRRIAATCLRGDPGERYASCEALARDLRAWLSGRLVGPTDLERAGERQRVVTLVAARGAADARGLEALLGACDGHALPGRGDLVRASFEAPSVAVGFALRLLAATPTCAVGIHWGEVTEHPDGEVTGLTVEVADRLAALAAPGQALLSAPAFDEARQHVATAPGGREVAWRAYGPYTLEGLERVVGVCEAGLEGTSPLRAPDDSPRARRVQAPDAILGWRPAPGLAIPRRPNWTLTRKLGEGGFGEVWLATHATTQDRRAFKFGFRADRLRQLKREVILFTVLRDTLDKRWDIAQILDWQFEEAPFFIESEYSPCGSLVDWADAQGGLSRLPLELRLELVAQVAEALGAAHGVGVLHKDVKPQNVLIQRFGAATTAQLADFGVGVTTSREPLDRVGDVTRQITTASPTEVWAGAQAEACSRLYMAPELLEGAPATPRSDIYALGVMLYQVVRGDFSRALGAGWERYIDDPLLRDDIGACVDSDPARRLESAEALAARLRTLEERRARAQHDEQERLAAELLAQNAQLVRQRRRWLALVLALTALSAWAMTSRLRLAREVEDLRREVEARRER